MEATTTTGRRSPNRAVPLMKKRFKTAEPVTRNYTLSIDDWVLDARHHPDADRRMVLRDSENAGDQSLTVPADLDRGRLRRG